MIIWGTRNKKLAKETLADNCPNCGMHNCVSMHIFQEYAHLFWIPVFPAGKKGISQCASCGQVLKLKEMPVSLKLSYRNVKSKTRTPAWMFTGVAALVVIIIIIAVSDNEKDHKNAQLIMGPLPGDIFEIKTKNDNYTVYKVDQVQGDSVYVQESDYEVNSSSGLDDLRAKGFSADDYAFSIGELKDMQAKGVIIDIDRK